MKFWFWSTVFRVTNWLVNKLAKLIALSGTKLLDCIGSDVEDVEGLEELKKELQNLA